jgi:hypothetical protein
MEDISIKKTLLYWAGFATLYTLLALFSFQNRDPWSFSSTVWFPAGLLLAALWLSARRDWPLWLITAGLLHALCGVYTGRPPLLAGIFAAFDVVVFPLCVMLLRMLPPLTRTSTSFQPVVTALYQVAIIALCLTLGSILLSCCLLLAGYAVAPQHFISWTLAALTAALSILHYLQSESGNMPATRSRGYSYMVIAINLGMMFTFSVTDTGPWMGLNPLWVQLSVLLLSVFVLSARQAGLLLILQYIIMTTAISFALSPQATILAAWQTQWYLIFSAILTGCLSQFVTSHHRLLCTTQSEQEVIVQLAGSATCLMFYLNLPEGEIEWRGSPSVFFPNEALSVSTLVLLNAHCSPPFIADVQRWYQRAESAQFRQQITVQRLTGEQIHCLLFLQRISGQAHLTGGIILLPTDTAQAG